MTTFKVGDIVEWCGVRGAVIGVGVLAISAGVYSNAIEN